MLLTSKRPFRVVAFGGATHGHCLGPSERLGIASPPNGRLIPHGRAAQPHVKEILSQSIPAARPCPVISSTDTIHALKIFAPLRLCVKQKGTTT